MSLAFSPAGCCCCLPLADFCTACGAEVEQAGAYEVIVEGMANCVPPTLQSCDDCPQYDGTYLLPYAELAAGAALRRCVYRLVLPEATCNQALFPQMQMAVSKIELHIGYHRTSQRQCVTVVEAYITAHLLAVTLKGMFFRELPGLVSCRELVSLELWPHPLQSPCATNVVCDFAAARMTVSWLGG